MNIDNFTIASIQQGLRKKEFSAIELCRAYLGKIEKEDKQISSFLTLTPEVALKKAKEIDGNIAKQDEIPSLAGVPFAVKDNILVKDIKCTAASKILANYIAPYDATVISKLKELGGIILGKTNMDEFAMGSSTENSAFGPTKNPLDLRRVPGGSSGGSAAAVAANFCVFSLGSDTGGSIRQPASFCGVVGLKPTYGAVSRYGLISFASSLDQIGPIARTVQDIKVVFDAIKGKDEFDSTSVDFPSKLEKEKDIRSIKIGIPKEYFIEGIDQRVKDVIVKAIKNYETMGLRIEEISLPHTQYALSCYYIIAPSEASANLARYDGIKYGYSVEGEAVAKNLFDVYVQSRGKGFGAEVRRRIMLGTYSLSSGYYEAYYLRAQKVRAKIKQDFDKAFEKIDLIMTPVAPTTAFLLGEKTQDPLTMYLADIFTVAVSLAGLPALSLPVGSIDGLPIGLQIIAKPFKEDTIFKVAENYAV